MAFLVHRAGRADLLAEGLAELLRTPLSDPFARELVIVPAHGIERWLSQRLSHHLGHGVGAADGVCAGVDFRSPGSLVAELTGTRDTDPWAPESMVWQLLEVVDAAAGEAWCSALSAHLGVGQTGEEHELRQGRRYAVARRLARLFSSYAGQRPAMLADWEAGRDTNGAGAALAEDLHWQPELWRRLVTRVGAPTPGQRQASVLDRLRRSPEAFELPGRLSLFGHTRIPVTEIELLTALADGRDVHLWLPHPSPALWQALADVTGPAGAVVRRDDTSHLQAHHPLLASLGRDLRELQRLLPSESDLLTAPEPRPTTLLGWLQDDLAANRLPDEPRVLPTEDRSISVHSCHGPARQVEVLREVLVGLLEDDPTLEPRDIMVMCPDIEAYAPLVSAAFGLGDLLPDGHPGQHLRVQLADRALTQTNPLLAVAMQLLEIVGGRAEASRVLDLLALEPVRRRFGFSDEDLERIGRWVRDAGVRWAFDAEHRATYSLSGVVQNTWQFGLDRILAGAAVSDDAGRWFGTALPLDDVSGTDIELAGQLAECLERIQRGVDALVGAHPPEHWVSTLSDTLAGLTEVARGDEWQTGQVQRELAAIGASAGAGTMLRLTDVRALLEERFAGRPTRANFRTGNLTIATLTPMRSVPHRVVVLLGLDDGVFPRAGAVDGDDVLSRVPLTGERDLRSEDRQLMLDAIMAATERLVITYTGASESTGQRRPPAVPLKELLDALDLTAADAGRAVVHLERLQAFDPRNFAVTDPTSFDRAALAGARAALAPRVEPERLADLRLSAPTGDIDLAQLGAFLARPVQHFLRHRLAIALLDEDEEARDAIPVELDSLQQWQVGDRMLTDLRSGRAPVDALALEWRRGEMPPGKLGWELAQKIAGQAGPVAELAESLTAGLPPRAVDVDIDLGGRRLVGTVTDVHDRRVVRVGFSRLGPRQELDAWLAVLALECAEPGRGWSAGAVGRGRSGQPPLRVAFSAPEDPSARLADLVALYDDGMTGPLPMPLRTAHAHARRRAAGADDWHCRKAAMDEWNPYNSRFPGENQDAAHRFVWGAHSALNVLEGTPLPGEEQEHESTRLGALAARLWLPILKAAHR